MNDRDRWTGDEGGRGAEVVRNDDGGGAWEDKGREVDGPRREGNARYCSPAGHTGT